ncbi:MAG: hypothetical protein OHK93_004794 [Ramalina farinacea]|uniref:Transcription factor TFIIIC complex subunit Tfc6 n=1 Tax=Ramalina farinacea TaxID=258253 RepID=A0AA43QZ93_9LECA|nr:hypothetical protein [Ramalina farinacea]
MASTRKSGRQHVPSRKLKDESINTLNEILSSDSEIEALVDQEIAAADEYDEFSVQAAAQASSDDDDSSISAAASSGIATPVEDDDDAHSDIGRGSDVGEDRLPFLRVRKSKPKKAPAIEAEAKRSRGLLGTQIRSYTRRNKSELLCGPDPKDREALTRAADRWANDPTLPRRANLRHPFTHPDSRRKWEARKGWEWYYDSGGKAAFAERQRLTPLSEGEAVKYLPRSSHHKQDVLLGPYGRQTPFTLSANDTIDMDHAWTEVTAMENASHTEDRPPKRRKHGWLLNAGSKVRCLDWATKEGSTRQYLAIGTKQNSLSREEAKKEAPSFASSPAPSSIQLWSFVSPQRPTPTADSTEPARPLRLVHILCTDWGDAKQVRWCPMPRKFQENDASQEHEVVGLLASVWDDGSTRVLDLIVPRDNNDGNVHLKIDSAACTIRPLQYSICTCMCWLSATDIAVGHSNGFLALYSIIPPSTSPSSTSSFPSAQTNYTPPTSSQTHQHHPHPRLIIPLHQSYILSLNSCYPPFPYLLTSTTIAGTARLTDLRSPHTASISTRRSNIAPVDCIYHHGLFACFVPDDSHETIGAMALRCWGSLSATMDTVDTGGTRAMDVGKCHAALAVGCADGGVVVSNPMRRAIKHREPCIQLLLWKHEWVRRRKSQNGSDESSEQMEPRGMSRITESYKARKSEIDQRPGERKLNIEGSRNRGRGSMVSTTFEEESGVTALAWNPNVSCGGWLAVAWATGLVRVEDVAI